MVAIANCLVPAAGLLNAAGGPLGNDFMAFYTASQAALHDGAASAYDMKHLFGMERASTGGAVRLAWAYPPQFLLHRRAALPPALRGPRSMGGSSPPPRPSSGVFRRASGLPIAAILVMPPLVQNGIDGQNGALSASIMAGALFAFGRERGWLGGLLLGLLAYKPQIALLTPVCVLAVRDWRAVAGFCATALGLPLLSIPVFRRGGLARLHRLPAPARGL